MRLLYNKFKPILDILTNFFLFLMHKKLCLHDIAVLYCRSVDVNLFVARHSFNFFDPFNMDLFHEQYLDSNDIF